MAKFSTVSCNTDLELVGLGEDLHLKGHHLLHGGGEGVSLLLLPLPALLGVEDHLPVVAARVEVQGDVVVTARALDEVDGEPAVERGTGVR